MVHMDHHQEDALLGRDPDLVECVDVVASCCSSRRRTSEQKKDTGSSSPVKVVAVIVVEEPLESNHFPVLSSSSSSTPSSLSKFGESVEWIDIDDEYFRGATASVEETSDWVLCAL